MVMLILLYSRPLDSGGLCHHLCVPSIAYSIRWSFVLSTLPDVISRSHTSHSKPLIPYFPGTVASLQNSSSFSPGGRSYPQVALAVIVLPRAMLNVSCDNCETLAWKFDASAHSKSAKVACVTRILGKRMNLVDVKFTRCLLFRNACWIWQTGLNYVSWHNKLGRAFR